MTDTYAAAILDFLDRDTAAVKRSMCYPITRIELHNLGESKPSRVFLVVDGKWSEQQ